jgi:hypothetical protein
LVNKCFLHKCCSIYSSAFCGGAERKRTSALVLRIRRDSTVNGNKIREKGIFFFFFFCSRGKHEEGKSRSRVLILFGFIVRGWRVNFLLIGTKYLIHNQTNQIIQNLYFIIWLIQIHKTIYILQIHNT